VVCWGGAFFSRVINFGLESVIIPRGQVSISAGIFLCRSWAGAIYVSGRVFGAGFVQGCVLIGLAWRL